MSITASHMSRLILVQDGVAGDAGVVDHDLDRTDLLLDLRRPRPALVEIADVELVAGDGGASLKALAAASLPA